jgi:hypothetical protein
LGVSICNNYLTPLQSRQLQVLYLSCPLKFRELETLLFQAGGRAVVFAKILKEEDKTELLMDEMKEDMIMRLLLKIKNGMLPV